MRAMPILCFSPPDKTSFQSMMASQPYKKCKQNMSGQCELMKEIHLYLQHLCNPQPKSCRALPLQEKPSGFWITSQILQCLSTGTRKNVTNTMPTLKEEFNFLHRMFTVKKLHLPSLWRNISDLCVTNHFSAMFALGNHLLYLLERKADVSGNLKTSSAWREKKNP